MKKTILFTALAWLLLAAAGCYSESDLDPTLKGFFTEDGPDKPKPTQLADVQAASGARADGMLHWQHFDGPQLNSLGEQKLSLMLADDDSPQPLVVYIDVDPKQLDIAGPRQVAVSEYLRDRGLKDEQIRVVLGDNPAARSPAAQHLSRQNRAESGDGTGAAAGSNGKSTGGADHEPGGGFHSMNGAAGASDSSFK
jgi:hypothetical protein